MRTLVTGGGGFLGSYVVERLRARGLDPFVPRRRDYDLTEHADVLRLFEETRPELVLHLAAEVGGIGANRANPGRYWYANLLMGVHVLEQSRLTGVGKVVMLGTICEYPKFTPVPFHEDELWNGYPEETNAPYGVAKKSLLVGGQTYREQYGLNALHLLPVNLYGPRDNFDLETSHVIPALIRKMVEAGERGEREIVLWGDGSPTREFLYVEDCADGILLAVDGYDGSEPVNLGTGAEISIRALAELIGELTGFDGEIVWDTSKPNGQPRRALDTSRAEELFGFRAITPLRDGLERTVAWYRDGCPGACGSLTSCGRSHGTSRGSCSARSRSCSGSPALAFALTRPHNGWFFSQGRDQTFFYTSALAARPRPPLRTPPPAGPGRTSSSPWRGSSGSTSSGACR